STSVNDTNEKRSYKPWYSGMLLWPSYQVNIGGFCKICQNYWKTDIPLFRDMEQKSG
ncbi:unnamed protein product, partial [Adineta steineri]